MKATEIRDSIFEISNTLYKLSDDFSKPIEYDGICLQYLEDKFIAIKNITKHIEGQIKFIHKKTKK